MFPSLQRRWEPDRKIQYWSHIFTEIRVAYLIRYSLLNFCVQTLANSRHYNHLRSASSFGSIFSSEGRVIKVRRTVYNNHFQLNLIPIWKSVLRRLWSTSVNCLKQIEIQKFISGHYLNRREAKHPYSEGVYILPTSREIHKDGAVFLSYTFWLHFMDAFSISFAFASSWKVSSSLTSLNETKKNNKWVISACHLPKKKNLTIRLPY